MAAVTKGTLRPVLVPGYEVNDKGQAKAAISKGDLLVLTADAPGNGFEKVWDKAGTTATEAHGIALMDAQAGGIVSVGIQGEMDGYVGLTPGAPLYPSGTTAGVTDTVAPTGAVVRMRAVTPTRVRYSFV